MSILISLIYLSPCFLIDITEDYLEVGVWAQEFTAVSALSQISQQKVSKGSKSPKNLQFSLCSNTELYYTTEQSFEVGVLDLKISPFSLCSNIDITETYQVGVLALKSYSKFGLISVRTLRQRVEENGKFLRFYTNLWQK